MQAGLKADHADMTADVLTWSDERGYHSHGAVRVEYYSERIAKGGITVDPKFEWRETGPCSAVFEGDNGCGYVASVLAMEKAIEMAKKSGIAVVGIRNISHSGSIGYYTEMAAKADLVAIACCQSDPMAVPYGGIEPYYGTNPISFAAPRLTKERLYSTWLPRSRHGARYWTNAPGMNPFPTHGQWTPRDVRLRIPAL